jgi:phenylalanyl-tRNA synthetase beta chain
MKIPYSWLCDFVPLGTLEFEGSSATPSHELIQHLTDSFNDLGLVVEGVEWVGNGLDEVVVAKVLEIHGIEGAEKIRRIVVDAGEAEPLQIVCGAFNFEVGSKVPLAKVGAVLPGDFAINKRKMRGVESFGMLCSTIELGLGQDKSGLMILSDDAKVGSKITDALAIVPDVVFDLAIENNRPDANCVVGVARDLAAWLKLPFVAPTVPAFRTVSPSESVRLTGVEVRCPDQCDRLLVALFDSVNPKPTPRIIIDRLNLAGMRSVSPIVDISNYLMLELGQPTHPYDADELAGGVISVRLADRGETVVTLDGTMRTLGLPDVRGRESTDVVIVDGSDNPVGLAGIMGGEESEIKESTSNLLLELAHFTPMTIARTSKRLGLRSEASARFEKGVDPRILEVALARFSEMLGQLPAEVVQVTKPGANDTWEIDLRVSRVNEILGTAIDSEKVSSLLRPIGFDTEDLKAGVLKVTVPTNRPDVMREIDVIEEVARHYGYRNIDKIRPDSKFVGALKPLQRIRRQLAFLAVGMGFYETWSATLLAPGEQERFGDTGAFLEVENPLAQEESILRRSLLPGLVRALRFNVNRNEDEVRFFEIGKVFSVFEGEINETERLAFLLAYPGDAVTSAMSVFATISDFFSLEKVSILNRYELDSVKRDLLDENALAESWTGLHPTRSAFLVANGCIVAQVGEVDRRALAESGVHHDGRVGYLELDFQRVTSLIPPPDVMTPISQFPVAEVDLAFEVPDSVSARDIEYAIAHEASEHIVSSKLFDVFRGGSVRSGYRSLAFSVRMSALDRTLSDSDISGVRARCIAMVESRFGAKLRG